MNTERMQLMLTMLKEVQAGTWKPTLVDEDVSAPVSFNMRTWVRHSGDCGFAACAVGHACLDKRFNDLGLRYSNYYNAPIFDRGSGWISAGWCSVSEFFGIHNEESYRLFNPHYYPSGTVTLEQVIERVEELLARQSAADDKLLKDLES